VFFYLSKILFHVSFNLKVILHVAKMQWLSSSRLRGVLKPCFSTVNRKLSLRRASFLAGILNCNTHMLCGHVLVNFNFWLLCITTLVMAPGVSRPSRLILTTALYAEHVWNVAYWLRVCSAKIAGYGQIPYLHVCRPSHNSKRLVIPSGQDGFIAQHRIWFILPAHGAI